MHLGCIFNIIVLSTCRDYIQDNHNFTDMPIWPTVYNFTITNRNLYVPVCCKLLPPIHVRTRRTSTLNCIWPLTTVTHSSLPDDWSACLSVTHEFSGLSQCPHVAFNCSDVPISLFDFDTTSTWYWVSKYTFYCNKCGTYEQDIPTSCFWLISTTVIIRDTCR